MLDAMPLNARQNGDLTNGLLDDTDRRLLIELQQDGRLSHAELGRRVGLSPPAVPPRARRPGRPGGPPRGAPPVRPPGPRAGAGGPRPPPPPPPPPPKRAPAGPRPP